MTQLFADGDRLGAATEPAGGHHRDRWPGPMVRQRSHEVDELAEGTPVADQSPALTAGKSVRPVQCVGCSQPTLPRADDNAPICVRCSDLLAESVQRPPLAGRWLRRRPLA